MRNPLEIHITIPANVNHWGKRYIRTVPTHARPAKADDLDKYPGGIIPTPEGPALFGLETHHLAQGIGDEWYPISNHELIETKKRVKVYPDGWEDWISTDPVKAQQIWWPFGFNVTQSNGNILRARVGNYAVVSERTHDTRIVQRRFFRRTFAPLK